MEKQNNKTDYDASSKEAVNEKEEENKEGRKNKKEQVEGSKQKAGHKKSKVIITIAIIIVVAIALGCGYFWSKMNKLNQTEIAPGDIESNDLTSEQTALLGDYTQIAVFGVDNRTNGTYGSGNSDTIMIASMNNKSKEAKLVSVYRDTYLRISDGYYSKANAAYAYNGAAGGISMLNTNFDLDIEKYVTVDWYAVDAINLLGGVEIEITEPERQKINEYMPEVQRVTGIQSTRLQESGLVHLDGVQAMAYMRIRKLAGNDYKRTQRQRIVIEATFNKIKGAELATLNSIVDEVFPMVETNLSIKDILSLAMYVNRFDIVNTTGFPFEKDTITLSGIGDCVVPITLSNNVAELHTYLFGKENVELSSEVLEISNEIIERTGLDAEASYIDRDSYTTGKVAEKAIETS